MRAAFPGCPDDAFSAFQLPWDVDSSGDAFLDDDEASAMGILLSLRSELHRRIAQSDGDVTLKNAVATITYGPECPASRALALSADALSLLKSARSWACRSVAFASSDLGSEAQLRVEIERRQVRSPLARERDRGPKHRHMLAVRWRFAVTPFIICRI